MSYLGYPIFSVLRYVLLTSLQLIRMQFMVPCRQSGSIGILTTSSRAPLWKIRSPWVPSSVCSLYPRIRRGYATRAILYVGWVDPRYNFSTWCLSFAVSALPFAVSAWNWLGHCDEESGVGGTCPAENRKSRLSSPLFLLEVTPWISSFPLHVADIDSNGE